MIPNRIMKDPRKLFWLLHLGGWGFWCVFLKYLYTTQILGEQPPYYFVYVVVISIIGMVITLGLRYLYRAVIERAVWLQAVAFLVGTSVAGFLWMQARSMIFMNFIEVEKDYDAWMEKMGAAAELYQSVSYISTFTSGWTVMAAWSVLYFGIKYHRIFQRVSESALKSAAMAHEAQLKMLRYQLNPHFLFNTLNAISTLVLERETELANRMVNKLSRFLRFSLDNDPMQKVSLAEEMEAIGLYLDIEKVRFEERLQLLEDIEPEARRALIPSLLLQPLVENAIKYGIAQREEGGSLSISARVFGGELLLELADDGPGAEIENNAIPGACGVGLRNTRERLWELYGDRHGFRLGQADPHGLTISIRIPYET
ncbi:sensor histidine kinase [Marinihelvus fidelis]|uniref:Sensor histidine kinase n=1 Tax=Marinihelvus fidelis TaxID=2613842 RepID=A0A5N0TEG1_9GAMM|nr:histidine kinase [Marinihelvus fidelis]KAA9133370.1 sensor histidine kinase [Marinihelvus fidelis]